MSFAKIALIAVADAALIPAADAITELAKDAREYFTQRARNGHFKLNKNNELSHIFSETAHFAFYIKLKLVGDCINHFLCFFPTEARVGN